MKRVSSSRILISLGVLLCAPALAFRTELYSEQAYLGRENLIANNTRVRGSASLLSPDLEPYLQVGSELMTAGAGTTSLDSGASYVYAGPGIRWKLGKLSLLGELRLRKFYTERVTPQNLQQSVDARAYLIYGDFFQSRLATGSPYSLFTELYGETVFTSGDFNNVILAAFVRLGFRADTSTHTSLDAYLEPFLTLDRVGHYYNNRTDLKPSLRFRIATGNFTFSFIGSYLFNHYFPFGNFDYNPYQQKASGLRFLAVVGGNF